MTCPKCGGELLVIEETAMFYRVNPENGNLNFGEPADDVGPYDAYCQSCSAEYPNAHVDWDSTSARASGPRLVSLSADNDY